MILVKDIPIFSSCEHRLVPFRASRPSAASQRFGRVSASELARVAKLYAPSPGRERLTARVADAIVRKHRSARRDRRCGGGHLCMGMRGIRKPSARTTSAVRGIFQTSPSSRGGRCADRGRDGPVMTTWASSAGARCSASSTSRQFLLRRRPLPRPRRRRPPRRRVRAAGADLVDVGGESPRPARREWTRPRVRPGPARDHRSPPRTACR
jgi:hypothetical protein